jgi:cytochrome c oxidase subunit 1
LAPSEPGGTTPPAVARRRATTLEWQTPETPPVHGNFGRELPVVYRWAYDYSVPGAAEDFIPQNQPGTNPPHSEAPKQRATKRRSAKP